MIAPSYVRLRLWSGCSRPSHRLHPPQLYADCPADGHPLHISAVRCRMVGSSSELDPFPRTVWVCVPWVPRGCEMGAKSVAKELAAVLMREGRYEDMSRGPAGDGPVPASATGDVAEVTEKVGYW